MPGSTTIVAPGEAASIAAWSESPSCTTTLAGVFAAETAVVESNSARAVINEDRDMGTPSRSLACHRASPASSPASALILGPVVAPPARDVLVGIRALSRSAKAAPCKRRGAICPSLVSGTGRCDLPSIAYRVSVKASLKCDLTIHRLLDTQF